MNKYKHSDGLIISLADSYYFLQKAYNNNLKSILKMIIANYGVTSESFKMQGVAQNFSINIGKAIFSSNNVFCGEDYLYEILLQSVLTKKYVTINYTPIYSNYQPNIYEESNYVVENPGIIIDQITNADVLNEFTLMLYSYSYQPNTTVGAEDILQIDDTRQLLSIYKEKQFKLSLQEKEQPTPLTSDNYYCKAPIFYGLEKLTVNTEIEYLKGLFSGYLLDLKIDGYSFISYLIPKIADLPVESLCLPPMPYYRFTVNKNNLYNFNDSKQTFIFDKLTGENTISGISVNSSNKTPFKVFNLERDVYLRPSRTLVNIQKSNMNTLINSIGSSYVYYPILYDVSHVIAESYNQHFEHINTIVQEIANETQISHAPYKLVINCNADSHDGNNAQRWYFSEDYQKAVFSFTTPSKLDDSVAFKTYLTAVKIVNYSDDSSEGTGPATLYAGGKELDIKVEIAGIAPYEDEWMAVSDGDKILISTNGSFTVPFYITEDTSSGNSFIPFNGYVELDLKFSK